MCFWMILVARSASPNSLFAFFFLLLMQWTSAQNLDTLRFFHLQDFPVWQDSLAWKAKDTKLFAVSKPQLSIQGQKGFRSIQQGSSTQIEQDLDLKIEGHLNDSVQIGFYLHDRDLPEVGDGSTATLEELEVLRLGLWSSKQKFELGQLNLPFFPEYRFSVERQLLGSMWSFKDSVWKLHLGYGVARGNLQHVEIALEEGLLGDYSLGASSLLPGSEKVYLQGQLLQRNHDYSLDAALGRVRLSALHLPRAGQKLWVEFQTLEKQSQAQWGSSQAQWHLGPWTLGHAWELQLQNDSVKGLKARAQAHAFKTAYHRGDWEFESQWHVQNLDSSRSFTGYRTLESARFKPLTWLVLSGKLDYNDVDYLPLNQGIEILNQAHWALNQRSWQRGESRRESKFELALPRPTWNLSMAAEQLKLGNLERRAWELLGQTQYGPVMFEQMWRELWADSSRRAWNHSLGARWHNPVWEPQLQWKLWLDRGLHYESSFWQVQADGRATLQGPWSLDPKILYRNYVDSAEVWEQGLEGHWQDEQKLWSTGLSLRQSRLWQSQVWNQQGVATLKSQQSWTGFQVIQEQEWNLVKSQSLRRVYIKVPKGTGQVRFDSLQNRYIEGVDGGDYRFWGYQKDSLSQNLRAYDLNSHWNLKSNLGEFLRVHSGFLKDLDVEFEGQSQSKDSVEFHGWAPWTGSLAPGIFEASRRTLVQVQFTPKSHGILASQSRSLELWEGQKDAQFSLESSLSWQYKPKYLGMMLGYLQKEQSWQSSFWNLKIPHLHALYKGAPFVDLEAELRWQMTQGDYNRQNFTLNYPIYSWTARYGPQSGAWNLRQEYSLRVIPSHNWILPYAVDEGFSSGLGLRTVHGVQLKLDWGLDLDLNWTMRYNRDQFWNQWDMSGRGYF